MEILNVLVLFSFGGNKASVPSLDKRSEMNKQKEPVMTNNDNKPDLNHGDSCGCPSTGKERDRDMNKDKAKKPASTTDRVSGAR
jgi:hypothetical protein